jgi:protein ImuA
MMSATTVSRLEGRPAFQRRLPRPSQPPPPPAAAGAAAPVPSGAAALNIEWPPAVAAALWRGDQLGSPKAETLSSGFAALDAELPGGGWPCQGITEILAVQSGVSEWRLLSPLLRELTQAGRPVVVVDPPHPPHPPGLCADGVDERSLIWVQTRTPAERLWVAEQWVRARMAGALVVWLPQVRPEQLRRLQVLAGLGRGPVWVCRPLSAAQASSAAPLRLVVRPVPGWALQVELLKRKGPPLVQALLLPSVPGGLADVLPPRLRRASPVPSFMGVVPDAVVRPAAAIVQPTSPSVLPH